MIADSQQRLHILLVEDHPGDANLTCDVLSGGRRASDVTVARDGEEALDMLRGVGEWADLPRPDLVLLDLSMPKRDGHEVLADIKGNPEWRSIPVVILSNSADPNDIRTAYQLNANCYITKPLNLVDFDRAMQLLVEFWLDVAKLPSSIG